MNIYKFVFISIFLIKFSGFSQDINQFDEAGKRHGIWKKNFEGTKVTRYEGEFFHGKEIGIFKYYKNIGNHAVLTATKAFNKDNSIATVKFLASTGKVISEGQMDDKKYIGTWKYYHRYSDNLLTLEHYNNNGELHGERIVYYTNGAMAEKQNYLNGNLQGESVWYTKEQTILKSYSYNNGELHGLSQFYNPLGELITEGHYKNGKKAGVWKYYENGNLVEEKDMSAKPKRIKKTP
ncbi:toxin-antitoxin system YwqK family antitoxin [Neotamlana laminarinivorans]|uniref:Toxin-antitoxin system YwqK family antitoxin n=1 Tax=Neotamlana laminarinivorans TaxID=2883124 RepID=A0A9X1I365_9FLAO|nr:toxin-antitoxin system YwqK family antitoxin [Tamlana laminarinivorans]MCB4800195.1 toxin-antitoxin system YwqK family antitoxin [Tamlana laminarinivorans]